MAAAIALAGCAQRPPRAPALDSGPRSLDDAAISFGVDGGGFGLPGRPDGGPHLPAADREIVLPYGGAPVDDLLEVEGQVGTLDVFFSIDTTGSFGGEIDNLQADLSRRIVPDLRARVADVAFGVSRFEDFPSPPFGAPGDLPFVLGAPITTDQARVGSAVAALDQPLGNGGDIPEAGAEALYQIATGDGYPDLIAPYSGVAARGGGTLGGVGFRQDALKVVVHVTDAPTHEPADYASSFPGTHSLTDAIGALGGLGVRALGISSGAPARSYLEELAVGTGAVVDATDGSCPTGVDGTARAARDGRCPLVFDVRSDGTGLANAITDAIANLLSTVRYAEVWGESDDELGFVQAIEAVSADAPDGITPPTTSDRRPPGDGIEDTFLSVGPGTRLHFRAILQNDSIPPESYDQVFNLTIRVVGDGITLLTRRIRVTVPRGRLDAGPIDLDAGITNDAGGPADAGTLDAGTPDAGTPDAGTPDASAADAGRDGG